MKKFTFIFLFSVTVISGFFSCKKDAALAPDLGYNYFPDQVGRYGVYNVDSFFYDDFNNKVDTFKFQLKEKIQSIYTDNQMKYYIDIGLYIALL